MVPRRGPAKERASKFRMLRRVTAAVTSPCRLTSSSIRTGTRSYASQLQDQSTPNSWERFLQGGLAGASHARVRQRQGGRSRVCVSWEDGHESEFSTKWLRDHAAEAFNPHTKQREVRGDWTATAKRNRLEGKLRGCGGGPCLVDGGDGKVCSLVCLRSFFFFSVPPRCLVLIVE